MIVETGRMMRRLLLPLLLLAVSPAFAADDTPVKGGAPGTNVELPFLMAPMLTSDGALSGYAYISARLTAGSAAFALDVRDKLAFLQDAFVRDINGAAVAPPSDPTTVDVAAVESRLLADARRVIGAAKVKAITVCTVEIADLHPKESAPDPTKPQPKSRCADQ